MLNVIFIFKIQILKIFEHTVEVVYWRL